MEKENELHFACEDCPYDYQTECRSIWGEGATCKRDSEFLSFDRLLLDKR